MIIENLDALKTWLSKTLEPICDADPSALAKYVVALVKKDKSEKELKALCIDQLDVFLQKETQIFVDKLFEAVGNRSYLPPSEQQTPAVKTDLKLEKDEAKKDESSREDDRDKKFSRRVNHSPPQSSSRYSRDGRALRVPEDKRDELQMRNQLPDRALRRVEDRGKRDERPRKREYERNPPRRDSYRDRYNRRRGRSRSYSRSRSRSWSKDRMRDRERDRERERERGRERDHSRSRTRSRSRERDTAKPKYDREAGDRSEVVDGYAQPPLVSTATTSHFPVPSLSSTITVIAPTHHHSNNNSSSISTTESWSDMRPDHAFPRGPPPPPQQPRKRCRDYDEKGFCMRGDMCPFDHGSDPVVVEDVNLPSILPFQPPPPQPPPGLPPPPPLMTPPPAQLRPPVPPPGSLPPSLPPVTGPPPPLPPLQGSGIVAPPNSIASSVPTIVTSGMRSSLPPPSAPLFSDSYDTDMYNPEAPSITSMSRPMQYRHRPSIQRPNLIGLTTGDMDQPHREKPPNHRVVMESDPRKRPAGPHDGNMPPKKPWFDKPSFGNHQGFQNRAPSQFHPPNSRLLVRQIPPDLNNISKLNAHFSQFGTIVNLQVAYQNDREGALVQFSNHSEAKRAMQSPEAVLGNRFIKVHWFRQDGPPGPPPSQQPAHPADPTALPTSLKQSVKDRLGPLLTGPSEPPHDLTDASQNSAKMSVKERLGFPVKPALPVEKVFSTSKGLTKTVFNPAVLKTAQRNSEETLKKKQEAMRLQQDVQKKKQQILEKHIETQKLLISKLDQKKVVTPEDRAKIMQTLSSLTQIITKIQDEIKASSSSIHLLRSNKTKAQAQKELLDTELDLYKKGQAGEDTALLKIKYTQLQIEAAKRGLLARGRGALRSRGRGSRGRGSRGRGRGAPLYAVVDHRPRALEISGFSDAERVELLPHFAQFGEIEDCRIDDATQSAVITYRSRAEAEQAAVHGVKLSGLLRLSWYKPPITMTTADHGEPEPDDEEFPEETMSDDAVLQDDDEEEDDNEPRSWRR